MLDRALDRARGRADDAGAAARFVLKNEAGPGVEPRARMVRTETGVCPGDSRDHWYRGSRRVSIVRVAKAAPKMGICGLGRP